jgi:quercetin dioxygenase-like cupin family protein
MSRLLIAALLVAATAIPQDPPGSEGQPGSGRASRTSRARITPVYSHALPSVPGKSLKAVLVDYAPGGASPPHRHARSALIFATVLEGTILCRLNGGPVRTYRRGENWTEMPGDHHQVSANASRTEPAEVLAVFVVDDADPQLTIPDPH